MSALQDLNSAIKAFNARFNAEIPIQTHDKRIEQGIAEILAGVLETLIRVLP